MENYTQEQLIAFGDYLLSAERKRRVSKNLKGINAIRPNFVTVQDMAEFEAKQETHGSQEGS